jgi:hypothetical protein
MACQKRHWRRICLHIGERTWKLKSVQLTDLLNWHTLTHCFAHLRNSLSLWDSVVHSCFMGYLPTRSVARICSVEWMDNIWIGKDFEGSSFGLTELLSQNFSWRDWGKPQNTTVRIAIVLNEIRTNHRTNRNQFWYRYANPLCSITVITEFCHWVCALRSIVCISLVYTTAALSLPKAWMRTDNEYEYE